MKVVSKIPVGFMGAVDVQLSVVTVVGVAVVVVVVGVAAAGGLGVETVVSVELPWLILGLFKSMKPFMAGWFGLLQAVSNAAKIRIVGRYFIVLVPSRIK